MGRPMPGVPVVLVDPLTGELADEGEICLDLSNASGEPDDRATSATRSATPP